MNTIWIRIGANAVFASILILSACGGGGGDSTATTAVKPKIYVVGASYSSDGPEDATQTTTISGDARNTNGAIGAALWVEVLASSWNALTPVSSSRTPTSTQSATNFARGGSMAWDVRSGAAKLTATTAGNVCNSGSSGCGDYATALLKWPRSTYDQWLALAATSPAIGSSDVFAIDSGGNDLLYQYEKTSPVTGPLSNTFINDRADVVESIVNSAIGLGFKKIVIANIPPLHQLPGTSSLANLANLGTDVGALNTALGTKVTALKAANPTVQFYRANWNTAISDALSQSGVWAAVSTTSDANNDVNAIATSNVMWWDTDHVHPSGKLHKTMADAIALWP